MDRAVAEDQRQREIVGHALVAQFRQHRKIDGVVRRQPAPQLRPAGIDLRHRAVAELGGFIERERCLADLDAGVRAPFESPPHHLRMQRAHEDGDAPQRQPALDQARA